MAVDALTSPQPSLFGDDLAVDEFKKAVQVLHSRPRQQLTLLQRKIGNSLMKHAIEVAPSPDGWWEIGVGSLAAISGFNSNDREHLKGSLKALMSIVFEWDVLAPNAKKADWEASVLFPKVGIRGQTVRFQLDDDMREQMLKPEVYALIDMAVVRRFRRAASLAIWEFCIRYERIGRTADVEWRKFRDMVLGEAADAKTYDEYKFFKSKVLKPAIAEVSSESNHTISLREQVDGRRVTSISFIVRRHEGRADVDLQPESVDLVGQMVLLGVPQSEARRIARSSTRRAIEGSLAYTKERLADSKQTPVRSPSAYFRNALSAGRVPPGFDMAPAPQQSQTREAASDKIKDSYLAARESQAEQYLKELDQSDQLELAGAYNEQQRSPALRVKAKTTKAARASFMRWLAERTWGEPTTDDLLTHAASLLSKRTSVR